MRSQESRISASAIVVVAIALPVIVLLTLQAAREMRDVAPDVGLRLVRLDVTIALALLVAAAGTAGAARTFDASGPAVFLVQLAACTLAAVIGRNPGLVTADLPRAAITVAGIGIAAAIANALLAGREASRLALWSVPYAAFVAAGWQVAVAPAIARLLVGR